MPLSPCPAGYLKAISFSMEYEDNRPERLHSELEELAARWPEQVRPAASEPEPEPRADAADLSVAKLPAVKPSRAKGLGAIQRAATQQVAAPPPVMKAPPVPRPVVETDSGAARPAVASQADREEKECGAAASTAASSSSAAGPACPVALPGRHLHTLPQQFEGKTLGDYNIIGAPVGEGTYGTVYRAECKSTKRSVALKLMSGVGKEKDEFAVSTIREIRNLRRLRHANIVELLDVCCGSGSSRGVDVYLVLEYCPFDLTGLMQWRRARMKPEEIKSIICQLLQALDYCHYEHIIHRDLKPSNILLDSDGTLKLCDFGLSRSMEGGKANYSTRVITLWYRPPELLLGAKMYDESIDIWSAACILGELLFNYPCFPESAEVPMLQRIRKRLGLETEERWPEQLRSLALWEKSMGHTLRKHRGADANSEGDLFPSIKEQYGHLCEDLMQRMLSLDPDKRCDCTVALSHRWFTEEPLACATNQIKVPNATSCHELDVKRKRDKMRGEQQQGPESTKRPAPVDGEQEASKKPKAL